MSKKLLISLSILIVVAAVAAGFWYYKSQKTTGADAIQKAGNAAEDLSKNAAKGTLPAIDPKSNPMEGAPDLNPISKTNPFTGIKTNPFK